MPANNVDLVLVLDASKSMTPCFDALRAHLDSLLRPLRQAAFDVRLGVVVEAASKRKDGVRHFVTFVGGKGLAAVRALYGGSPDPALFFTGEPEQVQSVLAQIACGGNEEMLLALDIALDFPFRPAWETRRVVALFTDEAFDEGVTEGAATARLPDLIQKLGERRVKLFVAAPASSALDDLACADGVEWETVDGGDGLSGIDFQKLLGQMAKSISVASRQSAGDDAARPLYGQDAWTEADMGEGQA